MEVVTASIKGEDENITGASFSCVGGAGGVEVGVGAQQLSFDVFGANGFPSSVMGAVGLGKGTANVNLMVDSQISVIFTVAEYLNPPDPSKDNVSVSVVVLYSGEAMFTKTYMLKVPDADGYMVDTSESGAYVGGGFSISMPNRMGAPYLVTFQRTDAHTVKAHAIVSFSGDGNTLVSATVEVKVPLQDKSEGFTNREREAIEASLHEQEGEENFLYKDSKGNVTIGVGFKISSEDEAVALPLLDFNSIPATDEQKRQEWRNINSLAGRHVAGWYEEYSSLYLPRDYIDARLESTVDESFRQLRALFDDVGSYPSAARVALQDMIYNVGYGTLRDVFVSFSAAVRRRDWATAAQESHRLDISEERNDAIRDLFLSAAGDGEF